MSPRGENTVSLIMEKEKLNNGIMNGKRGIVMGVANDRSIAWGIAEAVAKQGAEIAFTYQGDSLEKRVRPLAEKVGSSIIIPCDVSSDEAINETFNLLKEKWDTIDFVVELLFDEAYLTITEVIKIAYKFLLPSKLLAFRSKN